MTGKMATDGTRELITVVETISGGGRVLPQLIIYKRVAHYMGWQQHLDSLAAIRNWKFTCTTTGGNNCFLGVAWLKNFDNYTEGQLVSPEQ